jgi:hypothetical protein
MVFLTGEAKSFLQELEDAVSRGSRERCLRALWHTTDLLIAGRYSEDEIWTFGEVIERLAEEIELASAPGSQTGWPAATMRRSTLEPSSTEAFKSAFPG